MNITRKNQKSSYLFKAGDHNQTASQICRKVYFHNRSTSGASTRNENRSPRTNGIHLAQTINKPSVGRASKHTEIRKKIKAEMEGGEQVVTRVIYNRVNPAKDRQSSICSPDFLTPLSKMPSMSSTQTF